MLILAFSSKYYCIVVISENSITRPLASVAVESFNLTKHRNNLK